VPETLHAPLVELAKAFKTAMRDKSFKNTLNGLLKDFVGRPTPLFLAENFSKKLGYRKIYLKREDLSHTGSHKINNTLGQCLLAKKMKKTRVIAETGAGQHGVATATAAALLNIKCEVYMGKIDMERQALNVYRMKLLGAKVIPVYSGSQTLKDAINEAMRDWVTNVKDTFYVLGSVVGPHPYPQIVKEFQSVIGKEAKRQILAAEGRLPYALVACIGGGSNSMGLFAPFYKHKKVKFIGIEAGGLGLSSGKHAASLIAGRPGVLHGAHSYVLQDKYGQIYPTHSISAGLDYPGVGPEHSFYKDTGRAEYFAATDKEAVTGFNLLSHTEGIIPALEPAHALGFLPKAKYLRNKLIVVCLSGRGDKDIHGNQFVDS